MDIRFSGFGGQGIIKSGTLIGKAASIFDNKFATMTQNFGPEARGGACSAQLVVDREPVLYPYIVSPDILVVMSQEAYEKFIDEPKKGSIVLIDKDLVRPKKIPKIFKMYAIPATRIAEEMGNRIFANVIMIGFFIAMTDVVSMDSLKKALPGSVPERFLPNNVEALEKGYDYGLELQKKKKKLSPVSQAKS
ncbi:MAG: 2-oxoacid:acceptor oxidoreductase family protein [Candidatus Neomarinimicrobiota bacterium]